MFSKAIVKKPCRAMVDGITTAGLGLPDYEKALRQHESYIRALEFCGLEVTVLEGDERFPDSCFVEDCAIITEKGAVITRPGADSRRGEVLSLKPVVESFYRTVKEITAPGTIEGGDMMRVGNHFYIGLSGRTNDQGAAQMAGHLESFGFTASTVQMKEFLHLKTGVTYMENNTMLASGEFIGHETFSRYRIIPVRAPEGYAVNCIWLNGKVLMPEGFPGVKKDLQEGGYEVVATDVSEFRKLDGGLTCLSLRF
jgi:dimethylargininase